MMEVLLKLPTVLHITSFGKGTFHYASTHIPPQTPAKPFSQRKKKEATKKKRSLISSNDALGTLMARN